MAVQLMRRARPNAAAAARPPVITVCEAPFQGEMPVKRALPNPNTARATTVIAIEYHRPDDDVSEDHVGRERNQSSHDVGSGDGEGAAIRAPRIGRLEAELETHHEIDPAILIGADGADHRRHLQIGQSVFAKNFGHLLGFHVRELNGFAVLTLAFGLVVFGIGFGSEITAQPHGDGAGRDFRESRGDHQPCSIGAGRDRAGNAGGKSEGHGKAIGHADDDIADGCRGGKVRLFVVCTRH